MPFIYQKPISKGVTFFHELTVWDGLFAGIWWIIKAICRLLVWIVKGIGAGLYWLWLFVSTRDRGQHKRYRDDYDDWDLHDI